MAWSLSAQTLLVHLSLQLAAMIVGVMGSNAMHMAMNGPREFDYFNLALQWPGTVCRRTRHCCSSNACCRGSNAPTEFTIHGLWPDYNDGTWPACCTRSNFDEKEISTLLDALEKYWPSLSCGSSSNCHGGKGSFWAHEWEKHGTCSFPVVRDEYSYFLMTLNVYFKYNVTQVLNEAGYLPSNTEKYPLGGIVSAIENAFHATPLLVCSKGSVEELHLCFYKDFKPRDCAVGSSIQNDIISSKSSCPLYVSLPAYVSHGLDRAESALSWMPDDEVL
ncbi:ribonuclease 2 [Alnus glutinosa]|uniref:ribonuclease 2 n=1 Tax=Alnus glutinosa TaxID=3517 RepID=UPI002D76DD23|nr:ribonuclease 2 [Alnus glutinosa]